MNRSAAVEIDYNHTRPVKNDPVSGFGGVASTSSYYGGGSQFSNFEEQPPQDQRYCEICNFTDEKINFQLHLNSLAHQAREKHSNAMRKAHDEQLMTLGYTANGFTYNCNECQIGFETIRELEKHRESLSHILEVQREREGPDVERSKISHFKDVKSDPACTKFVCGICMKTCNGSASLVKHIQSETHQKKMLESISQPSMPRRGVFGSGRLGPNVNSGYRHGSNRGGGGYGNGYRPRMAHGPTSLRGMLTDCYTAKGFQVWLPGQPIPGQPNQPSVLGQFPAPIFQPQMVQTPHGMVPMVPIGPPLPQMPPPPVGFYAAPGDRTEEPNYLPIPPPPDPPVEEPPPPPAPVEPPYVSMEFEGGFQQQQQHVQTEEERLAAYWNPGSVAVKQEKVVEPPPPQRSFSNSYNNNSNNNSGMFAEFTPPPPALKSEKVSPTPSKHFGPRHNDEIRTRQNWRSNSYQQPKPSITKSAPFVKREFVRSQTSSVDTQSASMSNSSSTANSEASLLPVKKEPIDERPVIGPRPVPRPPQRPTPVSKPPAPPQIPPVRISNLRVSPVKQPPAKPIIPAPPTFVAPVVTPSTTSKSPEKLPDPNEIRVELRTGEDAMETSDGLMPWVTEEDDDELGNGEVDFDLEPVEQPSQPPFFVEPTPVPAQPQSPVFVEQPSVPVVSVQQQQPIPPEPPMPMPQAVCQEVITLFDDEEEAALLGGANISGDFGEISAEQEDNLLLAEDELLSSLEVD